MRKDINLTALFVVTEQNRGDENKLQSFVGNVTKHSVCFPVFSDITHWSNTEQLPHLHCDVQFWSSSESFLTHFCIIRVLLEEMWIISEVFRSENFVRKMWGPEAAGQRHCWGTLVLFGILFSKKFAIFLLVLFIKCTLHPKTGIYFASYQLVFNFTLPFCVIVLYDVYVSSVIYFIIYYFIL